MPTVFDADELKNGSTHHALATLIVRPERLRFETQARKEEVLLLVRRHLITNLPWLAVMIGMVLLPVLIMGFVPLDLLPASFRLITLIMWYLLTFAYAYSQFLCWLFNVNLITTERVVDIDFPSILYKDFSEANLEHVQEVSIKTGGFVRSMFNFGDVLVQTAGAMPEICFEAIPDPERVTRLISKLTKEVHHQPRHG